MLGTLDWMSIGLYFALVFSIAGWVTWQNRAGRETSAGYFLAGRNVGWFVIGASLFASNIGSEHLVGLAGTGASSGVAMGQFEVQASLVLLLLGWVFVPFYIRSGVFTMPEFLERRYSESARWYLAVVSIIGYVLTKISVTIFAGGIVFEAIGVPFWTGALIVVIATGIYTVLGGLRAVLYTDLLQCFVLIGGSIAVTVAGLMELGGWNVMWEATGDGFRSMWRPMSDPDFPWTGILFGAPLVGIWYWCTDQFIVQRVLSARDETQARYGTIMAGYLKQLPLFLFVIPGVVAAALAASGRLELATPDQALPVLIGAMLPDGLRGLVVAGLLAALMSSLSSVFNSCSTLITWDIYKKLFPETSERRLVLVGQLATVVLVGLGVAWIPLMKHISGVLYVYLQNVQAYISPPIAAVFLLGVFWRRANARGAIVCLVTGFVLGMGKLVLQLHQTTLDGWLLDYAHIDSLIFALSLLLSYAQINFLHFAIYLFLVCTGILMLVSYTAPPESDEKLAGLTYATLKPTGPASAEQKKTKRIQIALTAGILAMVAAVWIYFSPLWTYFS